MILAYVRVSTAEQNEARQLEALKKHNIDKWFVEKVSAKNTNRPQLQAMLESAQEGDTICINDFSRLARSTRDLLQIVELLQSKGVNLISNKENIDTSTPTGRLMLTMIGAINAFERENLLERQAEGIKAAKKRGAYMGENRKGGRTRQQVDPTIFEQSYQQYRRNEISHKDFQELTGLKSCSLSRRLREREEIGEGYNPNIPLELQIKVEAVQ